MKFTLRLALLPLLVVSLNLLFYQCTADQLPEPQPVEGCENQNITYDADISAIIENSCAYSGCHLDSAPGTFDTYSGLLNNLDNGSFLERVITLRDDPFLGMPPDNAPNDRPQDLTEEELQLIQCWLELGYPE